MKGPPTRSDPFGVARVSADRTPELHANELIVTAVQWRESFGRAIVHAQWDPEYSLRGAKLDHRSIQVGLSRYIITRYVNDWTIEIRDLTALADKKSVHVRRGHIERAKALLPPEYPYPLDDALAGTIGAN